MRFSQNRLFETIKILMKRKIGFEYLPNQKRLKSQVLTKDEKTTRNVISQILNVGRRSIDNVLDSSTESNKTKQGRKKKTTDEEDCQKIIKVAKQFPRKGATQLVNPSMVLMYPKELSKGE